MTRPSSAEELGATGSAPTVETVVTYLEMTARPEREPRQPPVPAVEVRRAYAPAVPFYRYLYETVGRDWTWTERTLLSDDQLAAIVQDPAVEVHVLWQDGVPAGYVELDFRTRGEVEVAYFGLMPPAIGKGLGRYLIDSAVQRAWRAQPRRVWVHTCDLDHPRALPLYESAGFVAYRWERYAQPVSERAAGTSARAGS